MNLLCETYGGLSQDGVEVYSRNYCYEKYVPAGSVESSVPKQGTREALDILLIGEVCLTQPQVSLLITIIRHWRITTKHGAGTDSPVG